MKQKEKKWTYVNKWYIILPIAFNGDLSDTLCRMLWLSICDKDTGKYTAEYFMAFLRTGII